MANIIEIRFPEDQQEGTEATVTRWLVAEGDIVATHDPELMKLADWTACFEDGRLTTQ